MARTRSAESQKRTDPQSSSPAKPRATLPASVTSEDAAWPGSHRGRTASPLAGQLREEVAAMSLGSVRRYDVVGVDEQKAFESLFRRIVDEAHDKLYGVQTARQDGAVFVRLVNRRAYNKSAG